MWRFVVLLVLAAVAPAPASAGEPDAAIAHPLRWSDPNGTPAGTRRSRCLPLTTDVEEAWSVELPGRAVSPIVYWEREAYVACRDDDRYKLIAFDVFTGEVTAKITLPKATPPPLPVVWEGSVFLRISAVELAEYRRAQRSFNRRWVHEPATTLLSDVVAFENEIYAVADGQLVRLRPRWKTPVWRSTGSDYRGRPALLGDHVYAMCDAEIAGRYPSMHVSIHRRRDGQRVMLRNAAWYAAKDPPSSTRPGRITVTADKLIMRGPAPLATTAGPASHVMLDLRDGMPDYPERERPATLMEYPVDPAVTPLGVLVLARAQETGWAFLRDAGRYQIFATNQDNPDLFDGKRLVAPTVLGEIVYFGSWAADLRSHQILWRLPVRELTFPAVPLDRMVIVIDSDTNVRAFRPRRSEP